MFGIGETELLIIVVFGFMIFGPDKLPGMGRTLGRALRQFRQAQEGFNEVVQTEVMNPLNDALNDPLDANSAKARREREAALASDADREDSEDGATAPRKETFAERKARLAKERKEREEAAAAEAAAETAQAADSQVVPAEKLGEPAVAEEEAKPNTSASALYAMSSRPSGYRSESQRKADEEAQKAAKAEAEAEPAEPATAAGPEAATAAGPAAPTPATPGKEDEDAQA